VVIYAGYRPAEEPGGDLGLDDLPHFSEIVLGELAADDAHLVVQAKAEQLFGGAVELSPALVDLVTERAQGNPFYLEELVNYLHGIGIDPADPAALAHLQVPDSLHRLVLSRIDMLAEAPRSTIKVASVVGRSFETPFVQGVYPELGSVDDVDDRLEFARRADLVTADRVEDRSWIFRHVVTREVAYDSLPFGMRTLLHHRVGSHLESQGPDAIERQLDLLAFHYLRSDDVDKQRDYVVRAGIAAQARYANEAAADYFRTALPLVGDEQQIPIRRRLGKVLELQGGWGEAEATFTDAIELAQRLAHEGEEAWARADLAECLRKQGRFDDARGQLMVADDIFTRHDNEAGSGLVEHLRGTLASQQGRFDEARAHYEASLAIRERIDDRGAMGSLLSNLAVVAENVGDLELAREMNERALAVRQEVGDRWAISVSLNNLGMVAHLQRDFADAERRFSESMRLAAEVGDRWIVAVGHHNLGNARLGLGHLADAGAEFVAALSAYETFGDRWSLALLVEDIVPLAVALGRPVQALELVGAADEMRRQLEAPRPPAAIAMLDDIIGPAVAELGADESAARQRGEGFQQSQLSEVIRALGVVETPSI
jgi:tetratricopeptide (TPR) repeat protein